MKRIIVYHSFASAVPAGDCYLPLIFLAELQQAYEVVFVINGEFDIEQAIKKFRIPVDLSKLKIVQLTSKCGLLSRNVSISRLLKIRQLIKLAQKADVCISTSGIVDFGRPAHHFICNMRLLGGNAFFDYIMNIKTRTGLRRYARKISTWVHENVVKSLFCVRSTKKIINDHQEHIYPTTHYVEGKIRGYFGSFKSTVFYPPTIFDLVVNNDVTHDPLKVVYVGRLYPSKRITDIIAIVERARMLSGKDLKLEIAGELPPIPYSDLLRRIATEKQQWLKLVGAVYGSEKEAFLLSGRYAVHTRRDEEFGIAIAEYLKAGIIPIVPNEGGACEIVDNSSLTFQTNDEAAQILARLLEDNTFRDEQYSYCTERAKFFTRDAYMKRQHELLENIINNPTNS